MHPINYFYSKSSETYLVLSTIPTDKTFLSFNAVRTPYIKHENVQEANP